MQLERQVFAESGSLNETETVKILPFLGVVEVHGTIRGAVKCVDPDGTTCGEGGALEHIRQSDTKARGAKRIRYPRSPSRKRCVLSVGGLRLPVLERRR